ncbi:hypothetical protein AZI86_17050 [Bdellovibrio bacteriovorus]|uniref:Uncharacterized protein n=1 Tax=Bdellovibrio bacteriovorus TaxID=959 RepID=A0A150WEZ5_BDEBC|nr:hypothetical protein [Bdellovibrio bacteriovorus]KYG61421.1 hypothetical protein AZI86_17050 [Bdellovibrio bacteriovorus]
MRIIYYILIFITLCQGAQAFFVRVGNNGDGVLVHDEIYLRDLYEMGIHKTPWFGSDVVPAIQSRWAQSPLFGTFATEAPLLVQKFSDAEKVTPGLGAVLISSLNRMKFTFSSDEKIFVDNVEPGFVALAVRIYENVYINEKLWQKMASQQRVALLIHEGLYSFAKTSCGEDFLTCKQSSEEIRPLVAQLFQETHPVDFIDQLFSKLKIAPLYRMCKDPALELKVEILQQKGLTCDTDKCEPKYRATRSAAFTEITDVYSDLSRFCNLASQQTAATGLPLIIKISAQIPKLEVLENGYINSKKEAYSGQIALSVAATTQSFPLEVVVKDEKSCNMSLFIQYAQILNFAKNTTISAHSYCH